MRVLYVNLDLPDLLGNPGLLRAVERRVLKTLLILFLDLLDLLGNPRLLRAVEQRVIKTLAALSGDKFSASVALVPEIGSPVVLLSLPDPFALDSLYFFEMFPDFLSPLLRHADNSRPRVCRNRDGRPLYQ